MFVDIVPIPSVSPASFADRVSPAARTEAGSRRRAQTSLHTIRARKIRPIHDVRDLRRAACIYAPCAPLNTEINERKKHVRVFSVHLRVTVSILSTGLFSSRAPQSAAPAIAVATAVQALALDRVGFVS